MRARLLAAGMCAGAAAAGRPTYTVAITEHRSVPIVSAVNPVGGGHSPCDDTFNPSYIPPSPDGAFGGGLLIRLASCANTSITGEHIGFAPCAVNGSDVTCGDVDPSFAFVAGSEDPRAFLHNGWYYNFYYASDKMPGDKCIALPGQGDCHVQLAKTQTPLDAASWQHITTLPWHRNGCCIRRPSPPHYCIFGEGSSAQLKKMFPQAGPWPMPGLGIATTADFDTGVFKQVPWTADDPALLGFAHANATAPAEARWLDALGPAAGEAKLEAGSHPVELSTGDYLHLMSGPTTQNDGRGNYTAGWLILDRDDPTKVLQRRANFMWPTYDYETACDGTTGCPYKGERSWVIFLCSAVPTGKKDEFRLFWGGGDGHVGTGLLQVTVDQ